MDKKNSLTYLGNDGGYGHDESSNTNDGETASYYFDSNMNNSLPNQNNNDTTNINEYQCDLNSTCSNRYLKHDGTLTPLINEISEHGENYLSTTTNETSQHVENTLSTTANETSQHVENTLSTSVNEVVDLQQRSTIKAASGKLNLIVSQMKAKLTHALSSIQLRDPSSKKFLSLAAKNELPKKNEPAFRKVIYDIVFMTTTEVQCKQYGAVRHILDFLTEELQIPTLTDLVKVDNLQNALNKRRQKFKKITSSGDSAVDNNPNIVMSMEELNTKLENSDCLLEHSDIVFNYLKSGSLPFNELYRKYKVIYLKVIEKLRYLFLKILKDAGHEKNYFNNFVVCFHLFEGENDSQRFEKLSEHVKFNILTNSTYNKKERPVVREIAGKVTINYDGMNIYENLSIIDGLYNLMVLQVLFNFPQATQIKRFLDFLMLCSDVPEKFVYPKGRSEFSRVAKRWHRKLVNPSY